MKPTPDEVRGCAQSVIRTVTLWQANNSFVVQDKVAEVIQGFLNHGETSDCDNIQCKQLHEYLDSLLDLYGLDKSGYVVNKAARLQAHWSELERYKKAVEWLESKHHDLHWDDDDFWTVWDAKKAMTGPSIISAIEYAMNPTE